MLHVSIQRDGLVLILYFILTLLDNLARKIKFYILFQRYIQVAIANMQLKKLCVSKPCMHIYGFMFRTVKFNERGIYDYFRCVCCYGKQ